MSIFKANKGLLSKAMGAMYQAQGIAEQQQDINFGRELLANIRQYRIQQAAVDFQSTAAEGIYSSGTIGATASLQGQLTQPYQYAVDDAERQEKIADLQQQANQYIKRYKKQAKTAHTVGMTVGLATGLGTAALAVATGGATTPLAAATWAAVGGAVGSGISGGLGGADRNYWSGAVSGTLSSAMMAGTTYTAFGSGAAATSGEAARASYTLADGGATMTAAKPTVAALSSTKLSATQYLAAGKLFTQFGSVIKNINGYQAKVPVSLGYTGGGYSQYVQSFRGFA